MKIIAKTKAKLIYDDLKHKILSGELKAGTRLIIHDLALSYGSSDIPVREALKELAAEDLTEMNPHKGSSVRHLSLKELHDMLEIRKTLEPLAARLAAENITPELIQALEAVYQQLATVALEENFAKFSTLNREFHSLIIEACGNTYLTRILRELLSNERRTKAVFELFPEMISVSLKEHGEIIQLLKEKKGEEIAGLMLKHKARAYDRLQRYFAQIVGTSET
ncbi:GntR family transcriptional regulator [Salmonella enterica]|uniref:GntR family transcriptional regulator n=1 Tax=Salmonella enterica TaxID=28901 RepID=UPI003D3220FA